MIPVNRLQKILEYLEHDGTISNQQMATSLKVSLMTVRRDLVTLEQQGLLRRVHGGAEISTNPDRGFSLRSRQQHTAKRNIGQAAALLIKDHETIYLDAGSTAFEMARALKQHTSLRGARVITHAVNIATELAGLAHISVIQIAGEIFSKTYAATGALALSSLKHLSFDKFFLATQGFDLTLGLTDSNLQEIEVKKAVIEAAREVVLIADSSKWRQASFAQVGTLKILSKIVTDSGFPLEDRQLLASQTQFSVIYAK